MSLDAIWDEPVASPSKPTDDDHKRPRKSLFFSDSDSNNERPPKRATPAPPPPSARPDLDALFEDVDKDDEDEDLRYKPLAPPLDLEKLTKEAEAKFARARTTGASQSANGANATAAGGTGMDASKKGGGKGEPGDGEKKTRKTLPKLDEERLVAPEGFPSLIESIKGFKPRGREHEHTDLNRLLQVYQFWTHKLFPKTSFKDTVNRVEKLCHSKRMQVRLSVWRDEFKGIANAKNLEDDSDVIDLTEPTLIATEGEGEDPEFKADRAPSRTPSLPPASSEVGDDDFDIDAVIKAEEERLATLRSATTEAELPHRSYSPTLVEKAPSAGAPEEITMDVDESRLWDGLDDPPASSDPPTSAALPSATGHDDEMWDIVDEMEHVERHKPTKTQIPVSGVNLHSSLDSTHGGNVSRATNDDDWDEMYS